CQNRRQSLPSFRKVAPPVPERLQRDRQPQTDLGFAACDGPGEGSPQVVVVGLQSLQPPRLFGSADLALRSLGQSQEVLRVSPLALGSRGFSHLLPAELPQRLQQTEPHLRSTRLPLPDLLGQNQ